MHNPINHKRLWKYWLSNRKRNGEDSVILQGTKQATGNVLTARTVKAATFDEATCKV
jgi:hypothetical protein